MLSNFRWIAPLVLAASLIAPSVSMATPVEFVFTTTIIPTPTIPGVSTGDTLTLTVVADNGNSTLLSQNWDLTDIISATVTVGTYAANYNPPHSDANGVPPVFETTASGVLAQADYFNIGGNNTDTFGASADIGFFTNAIVASISPDQRAFFASSASIESNWTATIVPEPSTLSLSALGLLGLAAARRRRVAA